LPIEWALVAAIQAAAPAPVFAPPVGVPLILTIEQRREQPGTEPRTTVARRRIVFHRDGAGWRADMTHAGASVDAPGDAFARALAATMAQPIVFRLDAAGSIVSIDALEAFWSRFAAAMRTTVGDAAARPLEAMPVAARLPFASGLLRDAIEAIAAGEGEYAAEPIDLPAGAIAEAAASATLEGSRTAVRHGEWLRVEIDARGNLTAPDGASAIVTRTIDVDPVTGLLDTRRDRVETHLADGTLGHVRTTLMTLRYPDTRRETPAKP
jgi:hypothetical protein